MAEVTRSFDLAAAPDAVWVVLADFGSISSWAPNVDHSSLMSGQESGVGAVRRIQAGRITVVEQVTEWDEGTALGYRIEGLPPAIKSVTNTWRLRPSATGTKASVVTDVHIGPRPPQQLVARGIAKRLGGVSDQMLTGLRDHVMSDQNAAPAAGLAPSATGSAAMRKPAWRLNARPEDCDA